MRGDWRAWARHTFRVSVWILTVAAAGAILVELIRAFYPFVWIAKQHWWTGTVPLVLFLIYHAKSPILNGHRVYLVVFQLFLGIAAGSLGAEGFMDADSVHLAQRIHGLALVLGFLVLGVVAFRLNGTIHRREVVAAQIRKRVMQLDSTAAHEVAAQLRSIGVYEKHERTP